MGVGARMVLVMMLVSVLDWKREEGARCQGEGHVVGGGEQMGSKRVFRESKG